MRKCLFFFKDKRNTRQKREGGKKGTKTHGLLFYFQKKKKTKTKTIPNTPINGEKSSFECLIELTYRKSFRVSSPNKSLIRCEMQWKNHLGETTEKLILL